MPVGWPMLILPEPLLLHIHCQPPRQLIVSISDSASPLRVYWPTVPYCFSTGLPAFKVSQIQVVLELQSELGPESWL